MSKIFDHREKAIKEIEGLLVLSGWQAGREIIPTGSGRDSSKPLFFKDCTPAVDNKFRVKIGTKNKILYCLYSVTSMRTSTASNFANSSSVNIGFTIYSSDCYEGCESAPETVAAAYKTFESSKTDLLTNLQKKQWGITFLGEDAIPATESGEDYWYRQLFTFNKIFY